MATTDDRQPESARVARPGEASRKGREPGAPSAVSLKLVLPLAVVSGVLAGALLWAGARWLVPKTLEGPVAEGGWTSRARGWFVPEGFYPPEWNASGESFSWTPDRALVIAPDLDRRQPYRLQLTVAASRPPDVRPPDALHISVDGVVRASAEVPNAPRVIELSLPPASRDGATIALSCDETFVPGPHDPRTLGVMVWQLRLQPESGHFQPTRRVMLALFLAAGGMVAAVLVCGLGLGLSVAVSTVVPVALAWMALQDGAFIGGYVWRLTSLATGLGATGVGIALLRWRWPRLAGLPEWSAAAGLVLALAGLRLALFAHPLAVVGDGIFQVHRAMVVHAGSYFFTSVTPRPFFEFPYPVALYVAAQPFWDMFPTKLDLVQLLRGLTIVADAIAALTIYGAARRQWQDPRPALLAAVLMSLAGASWQGLSNANLTNVFGQSVFAAAMGTLVWGMSETRISRSAIAIGGLMLVAAFLSHFSTVIVGLTVLLTTGGLMLLAGSGHTRRMGVAILAVALAAGIVSYGVYYSRFNAVYAATASRLVAHETESPETSKVVAPAGIKLRRWIDGSSDDYGLPGPASLLATTAGLVLLLRTRRREGFTLVLVGWMATWAGLTALEILTPVEMRLNLAAVPVFAWLGSYAIARLGVRSVGGLALASTAAVIIAWDGVRVALVCLGAIAP